MTTNTLRATLNPEVRSTLSDNHYVDFAPMATVGDVVAHTVSGAVFAQLDEPSDDDSSVLAAVAESLGVSYDDLSAEWDQLAGRIRVAVERSIIHWRRESGLAFSETGLGACEWCAGKGCKSCGFTGQALDHESDCDCITCNG